MGRRGITVGWGSTRLSCRGCGGSCRGPRVLGPASRACRFTCFARWSERMKRRAHTLQPNFFSPVCVRLWRESSSERENRRPHRSHWHANGFSPAKRRLHRYQSFVKYTTYSTDVRNTLAANNTGGHVWSHATNHIIWHLQISAHKVTGSWF